MKKLFNVGLGLLIFGLVASLTIAVIFRVNFATSFNDMPFINLSNNQNDTIYQEEYSSLNEFDIDIDLGEVIIKEGSSYSLNIDYCEKCGVKFMTTENNGKLTVRSNYKQNWFVTLRNNSTPVITITVPKDSIIENAKIQTSLGRVDLSSLTITKLQATSNLGQIVISNLLVNTGTINASLGDVQISNTEANTLSMNLSMGAASFRGIINHELEIDNSMGETTVMVQGELNDFELKLDVAMGSIEYDGNTKDGLDQKLNINSNAEKLIDVNNSMGSVKISFY